MIEAGVPLFGDYDTNAHFVHIQASFSLLKKGKRHFVLKFSVSKSSSGL